MKQKTIPSILIMLCMLVLLLPSSVSAATVERIVMTGNITPRLDQTLSFASEPTHDLADYTIIQMWMVDGKMFSNVSLYNSMLDESLLLPESERIFKSGKSYAYTVVISPGNMTLSDNLTVKLNNRKLINMITDFGEYTYSIVFNYSDKMHISSPNWKYTETKHRLVCEDDDGYVFEETNSTHDFDRKNYTCNACGYVLPESMTTTITKQPSDLTISCGDTLELSVEAFGADLRYSWRWGDEHSLSNSYGMKVSGSSTPNLKIENFAGQYAEKYNGIYCLVDGVRGIAKTKIANITAVHNKNTVEAVDGNGHNVVCSCGKVIIKSESHTYVNDKCTKCNYTKGSKATVFKSATLVAPGFAEGKNVADSLKTLQFDGFGIQGFTAEWLTSSHVPISTGTFNADISYILKVYPSFESNYYLSAGSTATITYNGTEQQCALISINGKNYFNVQMGKPPQNVKMTFASNGGEGTQAPLYADQYGDIYVPKCPFTKEGDEFFAWGVGEKLYFPGDPCNITKNTTATAVWKSELTKDVALTMSTISEGKTPSEIVFGSPNPKYSVSAVWYEGDSVDKFKKVDNTTPLSVSKNYTVQLTINSTAFFADQDELNITLNGKKMENILQRESKKVILDVQILNDVSVEFWEPMDGVPLATSSEITPNSDKFSVISTRWYGRINALPGEQYTDGTAAIPGKKYYLALTLQSATENLILGGDTVKVNGIPYRTEDRDIPSDKDSIILILEFITVDALVKISEDSEGYIIVDSPKDINVTFATALYDSYGRLIDLTTAPNFALKTGPNKIPTPNIIESTKVPKFLLRTNGEKVKIMVLRSMNSQSPICPAHNYKYNMRDTL